MPFTVTTQLHGAQTAIARHRIHDRGDKQVSVAADTYSARVRPNQIPKGRGRGAGYGGTPVAVTVNAPHADIGAVAWLSTTR